jgi:phosphoglycerol transferase MdoB-like AlkP superfamily enzyme
MSHQQTEARRVAWRGWRLTRDRTALVRLLARWLTAHPQARPLPTALSGYLLFAVLLIFPATLKVIKAIDVTERQLAALDLLRVVSADVAVALISFGATLALARTLGGLRRGPIVFGVLVTLYLAVLLGLSALEHLAWARSSSLLDWDIFWYTILHYQELRGVIAAETTVWGVLLLVGAGLLAILPVLADLIAAKRLAIGLTSRPRVAAIAVVLALPLTWLALGKPHAAVLHPLTQSASVGLIAGAFSAAEHAAHATANFAPPDSERTRRRIEQALAAANLQRTGSEGRPKNVMVVVLESTRFDATTVYVPRLRTTPRLQKLAEPGLVVDRAYVDMPHTSKALVSVLCGYSPRFSVEISEASPGGLPRPCLGHVFGRLGYQRAFFQAATGTYESRHQFALNAGYEEIFTRESYDESGFEESNYLSVEDKVMVQPILRWVEKNKHKPFFLTVLTCISHHSYGLPSDFPLRQYPRQPARMGGRMPRPWTDYNRYLNTVEYGDQFLGDLVDGLQKKKLLDDTLIVVVGDHGQGFFEHGQKAHNTVIWEEGLRVPLVFHNTKLFPERRVVEGVRRQVDIAPTVLTQLGVSYPAELFEGRDLTSAPEHEHAFSSCWYDDRCAAETSGNLRVIDHFDNQPMEVYDLGTDPFERRNLLAASSSAEKKKWQAVAHDARERLRAHSERLEVQYGRGELSEHEFVLSRAPAPSFEVRARLEDSIELIGFDSPSLDVVPDTFWEAVVYFKCLKPSTLGWRLFGTLETVDGRQEQVDHHPANNRFYLHECKPGMIVADHMRVWIPGDFPPGEARYWWGSVLLKDLGHVTRDNKRLGRREITPLQRGVLVKNQALLLAKLNVQREYRAELSDLMQEAVLKKAPAIAKPLEVEFGDDLVLLEARVEPTQARRMASITVKTTWRVEGRVEGPWQILVHMDSHAPGYWLRRAHTPVDGIHPIANWEPGTWVVDTYTMPIPEYMPLGEVKVWVGVRTMNRRMKVDDEGNGTILDRRALAGTVEVRP